MEDAKNNPSDDMPQYPQSTCSAFDSVHEESIDLLEINTRARCKVLLIVPVIIIPGLCIMFIYDRLNTIHVTIGSLIASWVIFYNFPLIGIAIQRRPLYVDDLMMKNQSFDIKYKFINYYSLATNIFLSILVSSISDYALYKINQSGDNRSIIEMFGIIGGLFSLYFKFQHMVGKFVLNVCYMMKTRTNNEKRSKDVYFKQNNEEVVCKGQEVDEQIKRVYQEERCKVPEESVRGVGNKTEINDDIIAI